MDQVHDAIRDVRARLAKLNFLPALGGGDGGDEDASRWELESEARATRSGLLHVLLFSGGWPNIFLGKPPKDSHTSGLSEEDLTRTLPPATAQQHAELQRARERDCVPPLSLCAVDVVNAPHTAAPDTIVAALLEGWGREMSMVTAAPACGDRRARHGNAAVAAPVVEYVHEAFRNRECSHWRLHLNFTADEASGRGPAGSTPPPSAATALSLAMMLKLHDFRNNPNRALASGYSDGRLGDAALSHPQRACFVPAASTTADEGHHDRGGARNRDTVAHPVLIDAEAVSSVVVCPYRGDAEIERLVLVCAFASRTSGAAANAHTSSGTSGGGGGGVAVDGMRLRCATLLPPEWCCAGQAGLALLLLLFAPQLELRTDRRRSRVLGIRVPGGVVREVVLEVKLGLSDLREIDACRNALTHALAATTHDASQTAREGCAEVVTRILTMRRPRVKPRPSFRDHPRLVVPPQPPPPPPRASNHHLGYQYGGRHTDGDRWGAAAFEHELSRRRQDGVEGERRRERETGRKTVPTALLPLGDAGLRSGAGRGEEREGGSGDDSDEEVAAQVGTSSVFVVFTAWGMRITSGCCAAFLSLVDIKLRLLWRLDHREKQRERERVRTVQLL